MGQVGLLTGRRKESAVETVVTPAASGNYGFGPRFGATGVGQAWESFQGVTACLETTLASATVELWLAKLGPVVNGTRASFAAYTNDDFVYSGQSFPAADGSETWALAGWPCFEVRVKSGGTGGSPVLGVTAF